MKAREDTSGKRLHFEVPVNTKHKRFLFEGRALAFIINVFFLVFADFTV